MRITIKEIGPHGDFRDLYNGDEFETRSYDPRLIEEKNKIIIDLVRFKEAEQIVIEIER